MYCAVCGMDVFESEHGGWLHDVYPRSLATRALTVIDHQGRTISLPDIDVFTDKAPTRPSRNIGSI